ncbi:MULTISPECIES: hypothetical protein [unclassified Streptomyces]|uniref:hypothetical protein n=1 Tax=unclassified Streptomyces TaxID=2593676 RepID=UPI0038289DBE
MHPGVDDEAYVEELEPARPDAVIRARNLIYAEHAARLSEAQAAYDADPSDELALAIRRDTSYSLWHAMEAYHSQGSVLDVVGKQAKSTVTITSAHYLQSFNEQLGDLLKDLRHYTEAGEAFYRSAKYLQRMTQAVRQALEKSAAGLRDAELALLTKLEEISAADGTLLGIRSSKEKYAAASATDKSDMATGIYRKILNISAQVNAAVPRQGRAAR